MERLKMLFELEQDESGYPPAHVEGIWVAPSGNDVYEIDNIPFFVRGLSVGDKVTGKRIKGELYYEEFFEASNNSTYRIFVSDAHDVSQVVDELLLMGCSIERTHISKLIAVNVPDSLDPTNIKEYLLRGEKTNRFDYEEAAIRGKLAE